MTIFFNMKEVTMQISEKQVDNLEDKIIYKPAFQKQNGDSYLTALLPYKQISIITPVDRLSNTRYRTNGLYLTSSEKSGSRIISSLSFAQI